MQKEQKVWKGDGTAITDMWLLQMDLEGHSSWMRRFASWPGAYHWRRDFAERVEKCLVKLDFERLSWAGDGGVFVASGQGPAIKTVNAAFAVHSTFADWQTTAPRPDELSLRVSAHRARITTADDPGYCYGDGLNAFIRHERDLRDPGAVHSTVITSKVLLGLEPHQQAHWFELELGINNLGRLYGYEPDGHGGATSVIDPPLDWLVGAWRAVPQQAPGDAAPTWAYAALTDLGELRLVYCFRGDDRHMGSYADFRYEGEDLVGTSEWADGPFTGQFRLAPSADGSEMLGAWWFTTEIDSNGTPGFDAPTVPLATWTKQPDKAVPLWARRALGTD